MNGPGRQGWPASSRALRRGKRLKAKGRRQRPDLLCVVAPLRRCVKIPPALLSGAGGGYHPTGRAKGSSQSLFSAFPEQGREGNAEG
jgi:hypothetical protein